MKPLHEPPYELQFPQHKHREMLQALGAVEPRLLFMKSNYSHGPHQLAIAWQRKDGEACAWMRTWPSGDDDWLRQEQALYEEVCQELKNQDWRK